MRRDALGPGEGLLRQAPMIPGTTIKWHFYLSGIMADANEPETPADETEQTIEEQTEGKPNVSSKGIEFYSEPPEEENPEQEAAQKEATYSMNLLDDEWHFHGQLPRRMKTILRKVSNGGRIVIPKALRDEWGLEDGDYIELFRTYNTPSEHVIIRKVKSHEPR